MLALHRSSGEQVAIKRSLAADATQANRAWQEGMKLVELRHELIVHVREVFQEDYLGKVV